MERVTLAAVLFVVAFLVAGGVLVIVLNHEQIPIDSASPILYTYQIIKMYPHDATAFTEGLVFNEGVLYESTGEYGSSSLRQVNLEDGVVQHEVLLPKQYFGEGLTIVNGSLVQLTWQNKIGFIYDKETFGSLGNFSYSSEGWGLTFNGSELIMSDGTSKLTFLNPVTFQIVGQVSVHDGNTPITNINELEYVNGNVYANIWMQQKIAVINPQTGTVKGWIDLTGIYQSNNLDDVLNGIAYDPQTNRLLITGKDWPNLYEITIKPTN
ncbi:MAG TPA: glutaminyl-peptide cyclotransferase [Candidatus Bathyarchaeia archaeon]